MLGGYLYIYGLAIICSCVPTVPPISDIMSVYYNHEINRAFALKVCLWAGLPTLGTWSRLTKLKRYRNVSWSCYFPSAFYLIYLHNGRCDRKTWGLWRRLYAVLQQWVDNLGSFLSQQKLIYLTSPIRGVIMRFPSFMAL